VGGGTSGVHMDANAPVGGGGQRVRRGWPGGQAGVGWGEAPPELEEGQSGCRGHGKEKIRV
jgi:hypothetical protein